MTSSDGNNHGQDTGHERIDGFDNDPFADLTELLEHNFVSAEPEREPSTGSVESLSDDERLDRVLAELAETPVADLHDAECHDGEEMQAAGSAKADLQTLDFEAEFAQALDAELGAGAYRSVVIARTSVPHRIQDEAPRTIGGSTAGAAASPAPEDTSYANWIAPRGAGRKPSLAVIKDSERTAASPFQVVSKASRAPSMDEAFDASLDIELELALSGLSAPANPRQIPFHRSEAFAPDRSDATPKHHSEEKPFDDFDELIASELAAMRPLATSQMATHAASHATIAYDTASEPHPDSAVSEDAGDWNDSPATQASRAERVTPILVGGTALRKANRSWGLGASVLAITVIGGLGAYVLTGDDLIGAPGDVLVVKADTSPIKVAPQDPGGRSIPNQNKAVYERVQSAAADVQPSQKTLLTAVQEPVDLPKADDNGLPGVDLSPITGARAAELARTNAASVPGVSTVAEPEPNVLQPRHVRTLTVRPDGTLVVENAEPAGSPSSASGAPAMLETAAKPVETPASTTAPPARTEPVEADPAIAKSVAPKPAKEQVRTASIEAEKPSPAVDVAPVASSAYYVQISSQPTEDAARQSQSNLTKRYASVIGGRNVVIQSADIKGKGTYYRVRVGAESRDEANSLCASLKSAGGNCFVSR